MNRVVERVNFNIPEPPKATRVAAYARVSSGKDSMLHSLSAQVSYYSNMIQKKLMDTTEIDRKLNDMTVEIEAITAVMTECINENSTNAQDQDTYKEKYNSYLERYETAQMQYDELVMQREEKESKGKRIDRFLSDLSSRQNLMEEFDNCLWLTVIDRVIVRRDGVLVFCFYDGREIKG